MLIHGLGHDVHIWLCTEPVDMCKSFDGLSVIANHHLLKIPTSGDLFVFINRKRTYVKVLYFDGAGYCLWSKRLERGTFANVQQDQLQWTELTLLLEGIELDSIKRRKRYQPPCLHVHNRLC